MAIDSGNLLGSFLKRRRAHIDPQALGFGMGRRRTPGLRREEVAQRANVSPTWYTWLEQGRGGTPSAESLDRIADALELSRAEREHVFLLAQRRSPHADLEFCTGVSPTLQGVLDALETSPAYVKTAATDVVAWNRAAAAVMTDYGRLAPEDRNLLRLLFCDPRVRAKMPNWERDARFAVATFRLDATRTGFKERINEVVDRLSRDSAEFRAMWADDEVSNYSEGAKHILHPVAGPLVLQYSAFVVDGQPDLGMVVYTPVTPSDGDRIRSMIAEGVDGWTDLPATSAR